MSSRPERFEGWTFIKGMWGAMLDRPSVQDIMREVQTPAMLRVKLLTTLLNDEFVDKEADLFASNRTIRDLESEVNGLKAVLQEIGLVGRMVNCRCSNNCRMKC